MEFQNLPAIPTQYRFFRILSKSSAPRNDECCQYEVYRLSTFRNWPAYSDVSTIFLAKAGLYFTGINDETKCFKCGVKIANWNNTKDVYQEHKQNSPTCPLILGTDSTNKPMVLIDEGNGGDSLIRTSSENRVEENSQASDKPVIPAHSGPRSLASNNNEVLMSTARMNSSNSLPNQLPRHQQDQPVTEMALHEQTDGNQGNEDERHNTLGVADMMVVGNRLKTFTSWPTTACVRPQVLAENGFFYVGSGDRVQCAYCNGVLRDWEPGDDVASEHQKYFGQECTFVKQNLAHAKSQQKRRAETPAAKPNAVNAQYQTKAMGLPQDTRAKPQQKQQQDLSHGKAIPQPREPPAPQLPAGIVQQAVQGLGVPQAMRGANPLPQYPGYTTFNARWQTFSHWPRVSGMNSEELAVAGFFYSGQEDNVRCFQCGGGLRNWEPNDEPWTEHARWFPLCQHIVQIKGQVFIDQVRRAHPQTSQSPVSPGLPADGTNQGGDRSQDQLPLKQAFLEQALDMGFTHNQVQVAVHDYHRITGKEFPDLQNLMDALLDLMPETVSPQDPEFLLPREHGYSSSPSGAGSRSSSGSPPVKPPVTGAKGPAAQERQPDAREDTQGGAAQKSSKGKKKKKKKAGRNDAGLIPPEPVEAEDSLVEQNRQLKQQRTCKVCMDEEVNVVFLPCGHLVCCATCAPALRSCPICRAMIRGSVKTFMS